VTLARASWAKITDNTSQVYIDAKARSEDFQESALTWFYNSFYDRLFDVHPVCRPQFRNNMVAQGKALVKMIGAALSLLEDTPNLVNALTGLAVAHSKKGVRKADRGSLEKNMG
jgi:hemoglobin-like flavoprotein